MNFVRKFPKKSYNALKSELELSLPRRTINHIALEAGLKCFKAKKKPALKKHHIEARKRFTNYWSDGRRRIKARTIIFTDEKVFNGAPVNPVLVRRERGTGLNEEHVNFVANSSISVNTWAHIGNDLLSSSFCFVTF